MHDWKNGRRIALATSGGGQSTERGALPRRSSLRHLLLSAAVVAFIPAEQARAQAIRQQWAGIVPGSNDYSNPIGYDAPQDACASHQNSFVPKFGFQVYGLIAVEPSPDVSYYGVLTPAWNCRMDAGSNGTAIIASLKGCSDGYILANGACLPDTYALTAEPMCEDGCRGSPGQFPAVGDPVSLATGAKIEAVTDYSSGGPYPIEIKRYYRSLHMPTSGQAKGIGLAWSLDLLGRRMRTESGSFNGPYNIVVTRADGAESRFLNPYGANTYGEWNQYSIEAFNGGSSVQGQSDTKDRFRQVNFSTFEYRDENDRRDTFGGYGGATLARAMGPVKSVWRGGYERNYTYDPMDSYHQRPTQISDSLGRLINLTWVGELLTTVEVPGVVRIEYTYTPLTENGQSVPGSEVLTQVARYGPNGAVIDSVTYQYERNRTGTTVPLLTGVLDAKGVLIDSTTYDPIGRALTAQGPSGADAVGIAYNDVGGTRTVTNALGQVSIYAMAPDPSRYGVRNVFKLRSVSRQQSATVAPATLTQSNDTYGFLGSRTDWNGVVTTYAHDARGNETQRVEDATGLARAFTTTWSTDFRVPTQIVGPNLTVNFTYDAAGNLTRREEIDTSNSRKPVSRAWTYTWNALGLLTSVTGPRTDVTQATSYTYDAQGNLATSTNALNHVTTVNAVNAAGLPTSVTDENGVVTLMTYDPLGRISTVSVQGPTPATTTFGYDANGLLTSVTAANNVTLTYGYDDAHRLMSIRDASGNAMAFALDAMGNRTQTQVQTGSAQVLMANSATFDSLGRLLTSIGAANQATRYEYDNNGNLTKLIDPRNAVTQTAFDPLNRVRQVTDALNGVTKLAYDAQDNVTSVTDARLHATTYAVNGFGFVTQVVSPDSGSTSYTYDLAGNVLSRTDARRVTTNYTYDALDRPLTRTYSNSAENVTYGYDSTANGNPGRGRLTSLTDAAGTASFVSDAYGNRISEMRTIGGVTYTTSYGYDLAGNLTKITYPSGLIVNYQRDALGQISGVTMQVNAAAAPVTLASNITYLPFGPMQSATLGNGVQIANNYDLDYRLSGTQATGATTVQTLTLAYDGADNITSITDGVSANLSQTFEYDLVGRVKKAVGPYGTDNYTYDALGNRLTRSLTNGATTTSTTYTYASTNNRLASEATGSTTLGFTYDANGALAATKVGKTTQASYTYNNDARLATAGSAALKYNGFGQRSIETVTGGGTHFIFAPDGSVLAEHNVQGALHRNYVYLNGVPLALVDATGTVSYILNDHIGQPQKMLDGSGALSWHRVAGIFGDTVSQPIGSTGANPLRFPGQQYSANTKLHYNYFRDYDPATGRYIEVDPIGLNGGLNPYLYVDGNPVVYIDRFGLCWYYSQSTGKLTHVNGQGKVDYAKTGGYAGAGKGKNNPAMQHVRNIGPIPQGNYTVGTPYNSKKTGPFSLPLKPAKSNNMFGRDAFLMHGDNRTRTASEGCIIFPRDVREAVDKSDDKCLEVTP